MNTRIIIATHKKYNLPDSEIFLPVQVGAEGKTDLGYTPDNTGDNISRKNRFYNELTGLYWAWKNLDCDVSGLVHYRRYFGRKNGRGVYDGLISENEILTALEKHDIILPRKRRYYIESIKDHFRNHCLTYYETDYWKYICEAVKEVTPDYLSVLEKIGDRRSGYMCNMFICRKSLMDSYCEWLFPVLKWMEDNRESKYHKEVCDGLFGFAGELLLNAWVEKNKLKIKTWPVLYVEKDKKLNRAFKLIGRKLFKIRF